MFRAWTGEGACPPLDTGNAPSGLRKRLGGCREIGASGNGDSPHLAQLTQSLPSPRRSGEKVPKADEGHATEAVGQRPPLAPPPPARPKEIQSPRCRKPRGGRSRPEIRPSEP